MKRGFTLIEILIVIVIIGILATIALPNFTRFVERAKADQAITYLRVIRTGERVYFANHSTYIVCANADDVKTNLGAEVTEENHTFDVAGNPTIADTFIATATRRTDNSTITLNQDGDWGGNSPFAPH